MGGAEPLVVASLLRAVRLQLGTEAPLSWNDTRDAVRQCRVDVIEQDVIDSMDGEAWTRVHCTVYLPVTPADIAAANAILADDRVVMNASYKSVASERPMVLDGRVPIIDGTGKVVQTLSEAECRLAVKALPQTPLVMMRTIYFSEAGAVDRAETFPRVRIRPGLNQHNHSIFVLRQLELKVRDGAWRPGLIEVDGAEYWISTWRAPDAPDDVWYWTRTGDGLGLLR